MIVLRVPPVVEILKRLSSRVDRPVELRREIVEPSLVQPLFRVAVKRFVRVHSDDARRVSRAPDSKRRHAEIHVTVVVLDEIVRVANQLVDVFSSPVVAVHFPAVVDVFRESSFIRKSLVVVVRRIRVEVIVVVESVDVVAIQNVADDSFCVRLDLFRAWIEPDVLADLVRVVGILVNGTQGRKIVLLRLRCVRSVRVQPAVELEAATVRFRDREFKWIPAWIFSLLF